MRKLWVGLKLDFKLICANAIKLAIFVLSMIFLCIAIGLAGNKVLSDEKIMEPFGLAIVDYEDSSWTRMIIEAIEQMETVTRLCEIQRLEADEASRRLENGEVMAVITIPDHFVVDVMTGENTPITVEKKAGSFLENIVVDKLITAGTKLLSSAQVGIYTTLETYKSEVDFDEEEYDVLLKEINLEFATKMLARNSLFLEEEIAATGSLSPLVHYLLSGFIMMMTLSLMLLISVIEPLNSKEMLMRCKVAKLKGSFLVFQKWLTLTIFNVVVGGCTLLALIVCCQYMDFGITFQLGLESVVGSLLAFGALSAMGLLIGMIFSRQEAYSLFIFLIALLQAFFAGGLIPGAFLPKAINQLGYLTYNKYAIGLIGSLTGASIDMKCYIGAGLIMVISLMGSCLLIRKRGIRL